MTQIEQKTANAAAESHPDGGDIVSRNAKQSWLARTSFHQLAAVNPHDILERWSDGEALNEIAKSYSVSPSALSRWLHRNASKEDRDLARELHYQTKMDGWLERLELDADDVNLARAREVVLRRIEFRAGLECERFRPQKQQTSVNINGADGMQVQLVSYASHTAEQQLLDSEAHNRTIIATDTDEAEE